MSNSQLALLKACKFFLRQYIDWCELRQGKPPSLAEAKDLVRRIEKEDSPPPALP